MKTYGGMEVPNMLHVPRKSPKQQLDNEARWPHEHSLDSVLAEQHFFAVFIISSSITYILL
jgi:hypothetical protein